MILNMKKTKILLIAIFLLTNVTSFSQNQTIEKDSISYDAVLAEEIIFDSNDPDEGLIAMKDVFKNQNISIEISNIKRDRNSKIIAIDIVMESRDGRTTKLNINRLKPIKAIKIYVEKRNNPNCDFGIEEHYEEIRYSK